MISRPSSLERITPMRKFLLPVVALLALMFLADFSVPEADAQCGAGAGRSRGGLLARFKAWRAKRVAARGGNADGSMMMTSYGMSSFSYSSSGMMPAAAGLAPGQYIVTAGQGI